MTIRTIREDSTCPLWPKFQARIVEDIPYPRYRIRVTDSSRAGGSYSIRHGAVNFLESNDPPFDDNVRARLTTYLIESRNAGEEWPLVTRNLIKVAEEESPLSSELRAERLLCYMRTIVDGDLEPVPLFAPDVWPAALAHSESTTVTELNQLLEQLASQGLVQLPPSQTDTCEPTITAKGNEHIRSVMAPDPQEDFI